MAVEEYESYLDELNDCIIRTVNGIVEIADKYQLEHDVVGKHFTKLFVELTSITTVGGIWIEAQCKKCGYTFNANGYEPCEILNYCPNCGAELRKNENTEELKNEENQSKTDIY